MVVGRIDVTMWTPDGFIIRDYKTGDIFEDTGSGSQHVKAAYQYQLKLYAALYADARGVWPVRLELMNVAGDVVDVPFTRDECRVLTQDAKREAAELWDSVSDVRAGRASIQHLASPGDACTWCRYKPVCPAYRPWVETQVANGQPRTHAWGQAKRVNHTPRGLSVIELETVGGPVQILDLDPTPSRNPALSQLMSGGAAAVFDASPMGNGSLRAVDQTVVYRTDAN